MLSLSWHWRDDVRRIGHRLFAIAGLALSLFLSGNISFGQAGGAPNVSYPEYESPWDITPFIFSRDAKIHDVVMSPDGKHVVVIYAQGENYQIHVQAMEEDDQEDHLLTHVPIENFNGVYWASNDRVLLHITKQGKVYYYNSLINIAEPIILAASRQGGSFENIWSGQATISWARNDFRIVSMLPKQQDFILIQDRAEGEEFPATFRVDILTGQSEVVQPAEEGITNWYANSAGEIVLGMGWRKKKSVMLARGAAAENWREIQNNELFAEGRFSPAYIEDTKHLIVRSSQESGRMELYRFDMQTGSLVEKIFGHGDFDVNGVLFQKNGGALAAVTYIADRWEYDFFNKDYEKVMAGIDRAFPDRQNIVISISEDERFFLIYSSSDVYPGAYYRYDREAKELMFFGENNSQLNPVSLSKTNRYSYFSKDGLEIPAYLTLPRDTSPEKLPLVVYPHGNINDRDLIDYDYVVQFLASRGIAVLQPNYRGSTGYGFSYSTLADGEWGRAIQDDLEFGVQALIREGVADPDRVCILGDRFAGYSALMASIQNPETYKCVVAMAAYVDLEKYFKRLKKAKRKDMIKEISGDRKAKAMRAYSPMRGVEKLKAAILLFHGENDYTNPMDEVEDFVAATRKAGNPAKLIKLKDTSRYLTQPKTKLLYLREIEDFLIDRLSLERMPKINGRQTKEELSATKADGDAP